MNHPKLWKASVVLTVTVSTIFFTKKTECPKIPMFKERGRPLVMAKIPRS